MACAAAACIMASTVVDMGFGVGVPRYCPHLGCSKTLRQAGGA